MIDLENAFKKMDAYIHDVKCYECDAMGITHHSNYVRFMEEARCYVLEQLGFPFNEIETAGYVSPVVSISVRYRKPTRFPDKVQITTRLSEMRGLKFTFVYEMKVGEATVCTAESTHCLMDRDGRPVRLEETFPELVEKLREL